MKKNSMSEKIYKYIVDYTKEHLYPPSIREIADKTGLKSSSSVYNHIKKLERLNLIKCESNCSRAIKLIGFELNEK